MNSKPFFIVIKHPTKRGYAHKNIGAPQSYILGPGQTCHWYKYKTDAVKRADELNSCNAN